MTPPIRPDTLFGAPRAPRSADTLFGAPRALSTAAPPPDIDQIQRTVNRYIARGLSDTAINRYLKTKGFDSQEQFRQVASQPYAPSPDRITVAEGLRLAAAGVIPGFSDELIGTIRGSWPGGMTLREAIARERESLASGRSKPGASVIELGAGIASLGGAEIALAKAAGPVARGIRAVTGLGKGAARSIPAAAGRGAHVGATVGAVHGAGEAEGGLLDRAAGAGKGVVRGGIVGGLFGGALSTLAGKPALDPQDFTTLFGGGAAPRPSRAAVNALAEMTERQGINPAQRRATAFRDVPEEVRLPAVAADFLGPDAQPLLARADRAAPVPARERAVRPLIRRAEARADRTQSAVERIGGRPVGVPEGLTERLTQERRTINNVLFDRARDAQAERLAAGTGRALNSPEVTAALQNPSVVRAVDRVRSRMEDATRREVAHPAERFVDPYLRDAKGRVRATRVNGVSVPRLRPFQQQDPTTIYNVAQEVGAQAQRMRARGNAQGAGPLEQIKSVFDREVVAVNPELVEANRVAFLLRERERAAARGLESRRGSAAAYRRDVERWEGLGDIPIPPDAQPAVASALSAQGLSGGGATFPGPANAFRDAAQIRRVEDIQAITRDPTAVRPLGDAVDRVAFGREAVRPMRQFTALERLGAQTEGANPTVQGTLNAGSGVSPGAIAGQAGARAVRDIGNTMNAPASARQTGYLLGDVLSAATKARDIISPAKAEALLRAGYAPGRAEQNALFRLIQQSNTGYGTPARRAISPLSGLMSAWAEEQ